MTTQKKRKLSGIKKISMKRNLNKKSKVNRSKKSRTNTKKKMKGGAPQMQPIGRMALPGYRAPLGAKSPCDYPTLKTSSNKVIKDICKNYKELEAGTSSLAFGLNKFKKYAAKYAIGDGHVAKYYDYLKNNPTQSYLIHQDDAFELLKIYKHYKELSPKKQTILEKQLEFIKIVEETQIKNKNLNKKKMTKFLDAFNENLLPGYGIFNFYAPRGAGFTQLKDEHNYYQITINGDGNIDYKFLDEFLKSLRHFRHASIDPTNQLGLQIIRFKNIAFYISHAPEDIKALFKKNFIAAEEQKTHFDRY